MIDGDRVYVGINRSDSGDSHIFLDGTEASIKDFNVDPESEEDLFITWARDEPSGMAEAYLEITEDSEFNDLDYFQTRKAMCQRENPNCHQGFTFLFAHQI